MNDEDHIHSFLVSLWGIQNSILQSGRGMFLTVETVLLSVAMFLRPSKDCLTCLVSEDCSFVFGAIIFVAGIYLCRVWRRIVDNRGYDDSYLRWQIAKFEDRPHEFPKKVFTHFKDWQKKKRAQKRSILSEDALGKQFLPSFTRKVLDLGFPCFFAGFWLIYFIYWIWWLYFQ